MPNLMFDMKSHWTFFAAVAANLFFTAGIFAAPNAIVTTKPIYVPNTSHQSDHLGEDILAWDSTQKQTNVAADAEEAHFTFSFTNVSPLPVTILDVHPSCGCTTAQLPDLPWTLPPDTNAQIGVTVNLAGRFGTLVKTVHVATDKGWRDLILQITILPPPPLTISDAERAHGMEVAKADRQAIFHDDCATCHANRGEHRYGEVLYKADCAICHDAKNRASMVPDLHNLKVPTNPDFWRTWIAHGKAGSLMPAFCTADGGPLSDMQIASLVAYLDSAIPSRVQAPK
jgi:mono/diheme cytochrome c family protein